MYTLLSPGHLSPPESSFKFDSKGKLDLFNQKWDAPSELTISGIRSTYLLGYYYGKVKKYIPIEKYNPNDILIQSSEDDYSIQTANIFYQGIFRPLEGDDLFDNQTEEALAPLPFQKEEIKEIKELKKDVLKKRVTVVHVHPFNKIDHFTNLYEFSSVSGCTPNDDLIKKNILNNTAIIKEVELFYQKFGEKLINYFSKEKKQALTKKDIKNVFFIENVCETLKRDLNDERNLTYLDKYFDTFEMDGVCEEFLDNIIYQQLYFGNEKILYISSSQILNQMLTYMDRSISAKNGDYSHPKMVTLAQRKIGNYGVLLTLKKIFNFEVRMHPEPSTFLNIQLYIGSDKKYKVLITYNDLELYNSNYDEFKASLQKHILSQDETYKFCKFDDIYFANKSYQKNTLIIISILVILAFAFIGGGIYFAFRASDVKQIKKE